MENFLSEAGQYGAIGLTLLACFWYINKKESDQIVERKENAERLENMHETALEAINNNTKALGEIKNIINTK